MQKEKYLPNVRRLFRPDPGYFIIDIDLSGADAAVVAWEAGDQQLKDAFMRGVKLHSANYELVWERPFDPSRDKRIKPPGWNYSPYDAMKRFVHATNYGAAARTIAVTLGWRIAEAEMGQRKWFTAHPGIRDWHARTEMAIQTTRTITNAFGYRIVFFDRPDTLLPKALAWTPQSTVGILCSRAGIHLDCDPDLPTSPIVRELGINTLIQAHDALIFQIPQSNYSPEALALIRKTVHIPVPYPDPLTIPWSIAISDRSWADCSPIDWDGNAK